MYLIFLSWISEYRNNGHDVVGIFNITTPQLLLLEPNLIQDVLVRNFHNFHDNEFDDFVSYFYFINCNITI